MPEAVGGDPLKLFSTCVASTGVPRSDYVGRVAEVARWSEQAGCEGILVYSDNSLVDPWLVSQIIIEQTERLCPLVAVQPVYMHPYSAAKLVTSLAHCYGRRVYLNMVAGGFTNDLSALNDPTPHDKRYDRLVEYTTIVMQLLTGPSGVSFDGEFYRVNKLRLTPPLPADLAPGIFVSGSSAAGIAAAKALGATAVKYPKPAGDEEAADAAIEWGLRVGIIARADPDRAWEEAHARFPATRKGQLTHQLAMKVSDSVWHGQLSAMAATGRTSPYWLGPFQHYQTMCPYLVGSHDEVAAELARYIRLGYRVFILDIPASPDELEHARVAFARAAVAA